MENNYTHIPVLLEETIHELNVIEGGRYIDGTLGAGGHSEAILKKGGLVLGIEADETMLKIAEERLSVYCPTLVRGNFGSMELIATAQQLIPVDGVVLDLGISNYHYDTLERGFSFKRPNQPLDLRLSTEQGVTGSTLLNILSEEQLRELFEPIIGNQKARTIVRRVVERRLTKPFQTVGDLSNIAGSLSPETFLALRIAVNTEFVVLEKGIVGAVNILKSKGRLAIISFHSLEDKIVSRLFKKLERDGIVRQLQKSPIIPSEKEIELNAKSRSALLRSIEKI